jgi:hypothetical protein
MFVLGFKLSLKSGDFLVTVGGRKKKHNMHEMQPAGDCQVSQPAVKVKSAL